MEDTPEIDEDVEPKEIVEKEQPEPARDLIPDAETDAWISGGGTTVRDAPTGTAVAFNPETSPRSIGRQEHNSSHETLPEREPGSPMRAGQDVYYAGDAADIPKLQNAMQVLDSDDTGKPIVNAIREHGTTVQFGPLAGNTVAETTWKDNTITINELYKDHSPSALAAYLAHEGVHVQSGPPASGAQMLQQEYACHETQAQVWNAVKGSVTDRFNDDVSTMIRGGKASAMLDIWNNYGAEYFKQWDRA